MTNSIASAKCSSVLTSGKYGMSQNYSIIDDSKEYIFVKLTDSAFRAIEEYQRNTQSKRLQKGQCAKIQFIGNAGVIHFPPAAESSSVNGPTDGRKFGFSIDDIEGSLECIQQSGADLDVLGSLNYRMRIHANDDVYDTTRTKMAIAEETEKSKCIREIKPNQTDIGRKVKRPVSAASIQAYTNSMTSSLNGIGNGSSNNISSSINGSSSYLSNNNNNHNSSSNNNSRNKLSSSLLTSPPSGGGIGGGSGGVINGSRLLSSASLRSSPNPSSMSNCGTVGGSGNSNSNNNRFGSPSNPPSSSLPSASSNGINSTGSASPPGSGLNHVNSNNHIAASLHSVQKKKGIGKCANSKGNGLVMSGGKGSLGGGKANGISNLKTLDVSRRKIRERLIHLLALKPFKKPELYSRLQNEGLAQRERQLISTILKDISTLSRDNTYNLRRSMWNDVDENWPFFSEQEIQQLKRRKPQNLTPPMSSDAGSSTSGQSPSSTHTGSPPPLVGGGNLTTLIVNGGGGGIKRTSLEPDLYDGDLTLVTQPKKQRISHYKKDGNNSSITNNGNLGAGARIGIGGSGSVGNGNVGGGNLYGGSTCQNHRLLSAAYSPHNYSTCNNNGNDDNSKNSDLTFNVLNNMDDFIQHTSVVGGDQNYAGRSKITSTNKIPITSANGNSSSNNNSSSNSTISILKEKRNSGGNSSSSGSSNRESSLTSSAMQRKNSPTPYANNFVPETKISSKSYGSCNSGRMNQQQHIQRQQQVSPSYSSTNNINFHPHKSTNHINNKNSVIPNVNEDYTISPPLLVPSHTTSNHNGYSISSSSSVNRSQHHISSSSTSNGRSSEPSNNHSRSLTPTQKHSLKNSKNIQQQQELLNNTNFQLQQQEEETQQEVLYNDIQTSPQTASHLSLQSQEQEQSWPTQQIAAAASTFSLTNHFCMPWGDTPHYDFSSYTPITTIEQRRKYKTEFESDYDEYRILLAEIESVGHRFRELADRLNRVEQGCTDYYNIKDQILSEYNRVCKEEAINRDKQRFDYLHKKLAHIKQLVMDYDKKLTSGLAMTTSAPNQQQHHQQQQELQNQLQSTSLTNNSAHLSPMLQSSGESNHSPPLVVTNPTVALPKNSSPSKEKTSKYQKNELQQHQQQSEHYQQHHEPETIKIDEETTSLQYHTYNGNDNSGNHFNREQQREQLHIVSPANLSLSAERKLQHQEQHPPEQQQLDVENHNNNDSESDSDSSSSSSSNDDDNSDDDISDASNDGDDDDNTDNDFNDDNHDQ